MTPVVSRGSGGLSGVQGPGTAIKVQQGCLVKMDTGSQFGWQHAGREEKYAGGPPVSLCGGE